MGFFDDIFGGDDASDTASQASQQYQQWAQKSIDQYNQAAQQGRGDIQGYYNQAMGFGQPYRQAGGAALRDYMSTLGMGGSGAINRFQQSPGYQFALQQGLQSVNRGNAAKGLTGSGAEQKQLMQYGQGLANQDYGNYQNRLQGLAGMGQQSAQSAQNLTAQTGMGLANLGRGYAEDIGGTYQGMGSNAANALMAAYAQNQGQKGQFWQGLGQLGGAAIGALPFLM